MQLTEIATDRLKLQPAASEHAAGLYALFDNWEIVRWLSRPGWPQSRDQFDGWLARTQRDNGDARGATAAILCEGRPIGVVGLDQRLGAWNLGYWLGQDWWSRGLMSEAASAMVRWFFATHDELFLISGAVDGNDGSLRVQNKLGFMVVGESMISSNPLGRRVGHIDTLLGRESWRRRGAD